MQNFFLIIAGPTGVGKSDLSLQLAKRLPIEIVNCDTGQFYEPVAIGTAKPDWKNSDTPHHLFDIVTSPTNISVSDYRKKLSKTIAAIQKRGNIPVLVGGSLFYVRSLFFPPVERQSSEDFPEPVQRDCSVEELWSKLQKIDPARASKIEQKDIYRISRALDIWEQTGCLPSKFVPEFQPLGDFHITFVSRDREELYERINERTGIMLKQGWVKETAMLSNEWRNFLLEKKLIGYPEIITCLEKQTAQDCIADKELISTIQKKTRNYAKRQCTYWRMFEKEIHESVEKYNVVHEPLWGKTHELNLTLSSVDLYLDHIVESIDQRRNERSEQ